jgi:phosphoesterase RecJ-like protein
MPQAEMESLMFSEPCQHTLLASPAEVASLLLEHDNYLICPHINPDPDSLGSAVGLYLGLRKLGKTVKIYLPEETPPYMDYLLQHADVQLVQPLDMAWKMIFVDLGTPKQLHPGVKLIHPWLDIDHHMGPVTFTRYAYIEQQAPATSEIIFRILHHMNTPFDKIIATCLYSALVFDTRNLTTPATSPATLRQAAELVEAGADPTYVNQMLNQQKPLNLMKLMGEVFANLHSALDDTLIWAVVPKALQEKYDVDENEIDYLISDLLTIASTEVILMFKETSTGHVKVSWRSKCHVDVNRIARQFGGGGHHYACGARLNLPLKQAVRQVVTSTQEAMESMLAVA